jgi:cell division protein FtsI/penicillin-binding protein 2
MAHVLGFVTAERKGAYGVEQFYNTELTGKDGVKRIIADVAGDDPLPFDLPTGTEAQNGASLELTIHSGIQNIAERELTRAVISNGATGGSIVILDARTGAIRGMASYPTANLNQYGQTPLSSYNNPATSLEYEPGSVFKVVTLACALDYGVVNMSSSFNDTGSVTVGGRTIYNHDFLKPGIVDLVEVMRKSLNVEAARMALLMGANRFYDCVKRFGFGSYARVDLAGEIAGTLKLPGDGRWYEADLGTNAFGQGIAATPLQMASALLVIANDGLWVQPHSVEHKIYPDGKVEDYQMKGSRQAVRRETARLAAQILTSSIGGESTNLAVVPGYKITGKTGTAQIPIPGGYHPTDTIASFGGYFPAEDPRYVIMVKIDRPKRSPWGSQVASPVFASVAQQVAALMALPPDAERALNK